MSARARRRVTTAHSVRDLNHTGRQANFDQLAHGDVVGNRAGELVRLGVDGFIPSGLLATRAAKQATTTIPIIGIYNDPVATGLGDSLDTGW
ncbi:MAG: hypothetical protein JO356_07045 [Acidobacteria bacterium]|nr:hypothetical protein [Acidobacteriota bacterium]